MRSVVFVERLEFEVTGNIFANAVTLGDIDNDHENELVVGNVEGDLTVFKGSKTLPWACCNQLGMITCVAIGDVCSSEKNSLVTVSADGMCSIFCVEPTIKIDETSKSKPVQLSPCFTQRLTANIKVILIDDIDNDGKVEFVVGCTDRVVLAYRWTPAPATSEGSTLTLAKFVLLQKWHLNGQVGSLSLSRHQDGRPKLVVSQPGCNYAELLCAWVEQGDVETANPSNSKTETYVRWHPISNKRARNANVSTELVGRVRLSAKGTDETREEGGPPAPYRMAMCTLDGTLMMIEDDHILWSLLVDHQLFAITKLDINCDDQDEVVVCAWDGQTYIVGHSRECIRFQFQEHVCAFCAGDYSMTGTNKPCLVYVTFNRRIYLYWSVQLPRIASADLQQALSLNDRVQEKLKQLGIDPSDSAKLRELYQWCLYGNHTGKPSPNQT